MGKEYQCVGNVAQCIHKNELIAFVVCFLDVYTVQQWYYIVPYYKAPHKHQFQFRDCTNNSAIPSG